MPLRLALGVRGTVAGHRLGALEGGGGGYIPPPPFNASVGGWLPMDMDMSRCPWLTVTRWTQMTCG